MNRCFAGNPQSHTALCTRKGDRALGAGCRKRWHPCLVDAHLISGRTVCREPGCSIGGAAAAPLWRCSPWRCCWQRQPGRLAPLLPGTRRPPPCARAQLLLLLQSAASPSTRTSLCATASPCSSSRAGEQPEQRPLPSPLLTLCGPVPFMKCCVTRLVRLLPLASRLSQHALLPHPPRLLGGPPGPRGRHG